ncbi:unnamed protein product [Kluyveromyces dobzhanskii CBS 2104]|uniref:WGS project CCBQ000000000 data, contig 00012 n=1 Tax=Kluyveromyces dobzhanskii CBS 2104 TaxID=1427455 RepID=A0A0A8L3A3_9SACH|nr:unnamed protein product [Kluyveromyces dobzhanskii CBS 2104]
MEETPKRQRSGFLSGGNSPVTPSSSSDSNKNDSGSGSVLRPSFLPSPRQSSAAVRPGEMVTLTSPGRFSSSNSGGMAMPQSPVAFQHSKFSSLVPPETPKSKNQELFLSPSFELQSPVHKPVVANQKPIREISNNLKSRLNYAYVKMQQNMLQQSKRGLDESIAGGNQGTNEVKPSSYSNVFAQDSDTEPELDSTSTAKERLALASAAPTRRLSVDTHTHTTDVKLNADLEDLVGENSAQAAFLKALQSPKKKQRSLSSTRPKITRTSSSANSQPSEVEAIETLMSLSSPHKRKPSGSFELVPSPTARPPPSMSKPKNESSATTVSATDSTDLDKTSSTSEDNDSKSSPGSGPDPILGSPKLTKPIKMTLHSEVQTDVETDVESPSE